MARRVHASLQQAQDRVWAEDGRKGCMRSSRCGAGVPKLQVCAHRWT